MANPCSFQSMLSSPDLHNAEHCGEQPGSCRPLTEWDPKVRRALEDPETLRTMGQAAQNPDLHREMLRNADRSLSNIEAMPGGHDALRRMYETVQAPARGGHGRHWARRCWAGAAAQGRRPHPHLLGPPLPNPWSPQRQAPAGQPAGVGAGLLSGFPSMFGQFGGGFRAPQPAQPTRSGSARKRCRRTRRACRSACATSTRSRWPSSDSRLRPRALERG